MATRPTINRQSAVFREEWYPKTASVAGTRGDFVNFASGYLARATSSAANLLGLLSADWTNDANNTLVAVEVDEHAIYKINITGGPLVQATHVGNTYDMSDYRTLNLGGTSHNVLRVVGIAADGDAFCKLAAPY